MKSRQTEREKERGREGGGVEEKDKMSHERVCVTHINFHVS